MISVLEAEGTAARPGLAVDVPAEAETLADCPPFLWVNVRLFEYFSPGNLGAVVLLRLFHLHGRRSFLPSIHEMTDGFRRCSGAALRFREAILHLELSGLIQSMGGGRYRITTRLIQSPAEYEGSRANRAGGDGQEATAETMRILVDVEGTAA